MFSLTFTEVAVVGSQLSLETWDRVLGTSLAPTLGTYSVFVYACSDLFHLFVTT